MHEDGVSPVMLPERPLPAMTTAVQTAGGT